MQTLVHGPSVRVIKLGGSLFELNDLQHRFHKWISAQAPAINLVIAGGGEVVEAIRRIDRVQSLDSSFVHWICIDLMSTSAKLAAEILKVSRLIADPLELAEFLRLHRSNDTLVESKVAVLQPTAYYSRQSSQVIANKLPESWSCTSDSIAAWLATKIEATELVLLKSTTWDSATATTEDSSLVPLEQLQDLAEQGVVDADFPVFARGIPTIRLVNLRDASWST